MIAAIRADCGNVERPPIATYRFFRESTVYYAGHPVTKCDYGATANHNARQELQHFLAKPRPSYVITTDEYVRELEKCFPGQFQTIFQQRRFLSPKESDEMVVLRRGAGGWPAAKMISVALTRRPAYYYSARWRLSQQR